MAPTGTQVEVACLGVTVLLCCGISVLVNRIVPQPYMDEIFHISQTERYMHGDFLSWDPKITTPPTLYLLCAFLGYLPSKVASPVVVLRCLNVGFLLGFYAVVRWVIRGGGYTPPPPPHAQGGGDSPAWALAALSLLYVPPLYFVSFLFYTDTLSTLLVAAAFGLTSRSLQEFFVSGVAVYPPTHHTMYYPPKSASHTWLLLSAVVSLAAVTVRQTNIVWAFFNAVYYVVVASNFRPQAKQQKIYDRGWLHTTQDRLSAMVALGLSHGRSHLCLGVAFVGFVITNHGIVLGDRTHHHVCPHLAQVVYFACFVAGLLPGTAAYYCYYHYCCCCSWSQMVVKLKTPSRWGWVIVWVGVAYLALTKFSYVHAFVLSDNRHYPFYPWRRLLAPAAAASSSGHLAPPLLLLLAVSTVGVRVIAFLLEGQELGIQAAFAFCGAASVATTSLVEFRYYIPPFVMLVLLSWVRFPKDRVELIQARKVPSGSVSLSAAYAANLVVYVAINTVTLGVFLAWPFAAPDGSTGRFMW